MRSIKKLGSSNGLSKKSSDDTPPVGSMERRPSTSGSTILPPRKIIVPPTEEVSPFPGIPLYGSGSPGSVARVGDLLRSPRAPRKKKKEEADAPFPGINLYDSKVAPSKELETEEKKEDAIDGVRSRPKKSKKEKLVRSPRKKKMAPSERERGNHDEPSAPIFTKGITLEELMKQQGIQGDVADLRDTPDPVLSPRVGIREDPLDVRGRMAQAEALGESEKQTIADPQVDQKLARKRRADSPFGVSLEEVRVFEQRVFPDTKPGDVPFVFATMAEALLATRGNSKEGIFRQSGHMAETEVIIGRMNQGQYAISSETDPHTIASLMKKWLNRMQPPLIPPEFYTTCIRTADNPVASVNIIELLPQNHRDMLHCLIWLLQVHFLPPEVQKITRMDVNSLAQSFAPCCFFAPEQPKIDEMVANLRSERRFFVNLMTSLKARTDLYTVSMYTGQGPEPMPLYRAASKGESSNVITSPRGARFEEPEDRSVIVTRAERRERKPEEPTLDISDWDREKGKETIRVVGKDGRGKVKTKSGSAIVPSSAQRQAFKETARKMQERDEQREKEKEEKAAVQQQPRPQEPAKPAIERVLSEGSTPKNKVIVSGGSVITYQSNSGFHGWRATGARPRGVVQYAREDLKES